MGIKNCECLKDCADDRNYFEKGRIYPVDLKTRQCAQHFRAVEDAPAPPSGPGTEGWNNPDRRRA